MFMQRGALSAGAALLVLVLGLVSILPDIISTARSQSTQETAIGPDARDALARMGKTLSAKHIRRALS